MSFNRYALSLLITAVISGSLAIYIWRRRAVAEGGPFAMAMAAVTIWSFAYGLELASADLATIRRWVMVAYLGLATAPVFWLIFALRCCGKAATLRPKWLAVLFVIPAVTILLNLTNERLHFFYYAAVSLDTRGPFPLLDIDPGPWYWVHIGFSYCCVLGGGILLARQGVREPGLYRRQALLLIVGAILPLALNVVYLLGIRPLRHIDLSPVAFTVTGLLITFGIFRYSLFNLSPIARDWLFEELHDPVLVVDAHGRLADMNRAARRDLGLEPRPGPRVAAATALAPWPDLAALCAEPGVSRAAIRLDAGSDRDYDGLSLPLLNQGGRPVGRIVVLRDVTGWRRAEAERLQIERQAQHMQKLESLGVLAGGIAHDYNNLLMAIIGNLDLARFDLQPDHPAREYLGDAEQAARRAAGLTRQLLIYAGKGKVPDGPVDLSRLVEEMSQLLQVSVGRMISFELRLEDELPAIKGDPAQIQQAVLNLITNASEAIGGRPGTVTLATGACRCDEDCLSRSRLPLKPAPGAFVYLTVADSGVGMDPETQERLFEPFFTSKQYGRGLGMAAVLGIVRSHCGAIMVDSAPGRGTRVTVLFPVEAVAAGGPEPAQARSEAPADAVAVLLPDAGPG